MILAVTERVDEDEATQYLIDSDKLDPKMPLDAFLLKQCKKKKQMIMCHFDASSFCDGYGIEVTSGYVKKVDRIDKVIDLTVSYDG